MDGVFLGYKKLSRRKRENDYTYATEILVVADHSVWQKFYALHTAEDNLTREQVTEFKLREYFVDIVSGMNVRYESINDPALNIYLTISGIVICDIRDDTNPLPLWAEVLDIDGARVVNGEDYLYYIVDWAQGITDPDNDVIMVFTELDLYADDLGDWGRSVSGMTFWKEVCGPYRTSLIEINDHFSTVSTSAHELAHILGAYHDGEGVASDCPDEDKFLMSPQVAGFRRDEPYTPNPWTFSSCSIADMKTLLQSLGSANCLLDVGEYYNETEYKEHLSQLPGQRKTADQQCVDKYKAGSHLCTEYTEPTDDTFCQAMACYNPSDAGCYNIVPARGTDCGEAGADKWCIEAKCVNKSADHFQDTREGVINNVTCADSLYLGYNCSEIEAYFFTTYGYRPQEWCPDLEWGTRCCAFCKEAMARDECFDSALYNCHEVSNSFLNDYGYTPDVWCHIPYWTDKCCETCSGVGGECTDVGYVEYGLNCYEVAEIFLLEDPPVTPDYWCQDYNWAISCCAFCKANREA